MTKYLICRPHGGMNDSLDVVEQCWRYAERYDRRLLVDMKHSAFCKSLADYFVPLDKSGVDFRYRFKTFSRLDYFTCEPRLAQHRINRYKTRIKLHETISELEWRMPVETVSGEEIRFDSSKEYSEKILIQESYRIASDADSFLKRVHLISEVADEIYETMQKFCTQPYVGIHIRNTDLQSDYLQLFGRLQLELEGKRVLVCSDDQDVKSAATKAFPKSEVFSTSEIPFLNGRPYQRPHLTTLAAERKLVIDSLTDLFSLTFASDFHSASIVNRQEKESGYSQLARRLRDDPRIVENLGISNPCRS
jgi:hypothetical protein